MKTKTKMIEEDDEELVVVEEYNDGGMYAGIIVTLLVVVILAGWWFFGRQQQKVYVPRTSENMIIYPDEVTGQEFAIPPEGAGYYVHVPKPKSKSRKQSYSAISYNETPPIVEVYPEMVSELEQVQYVPSGRKGLKVQSARGAVAKEVLLPNRYTM